MNSLLLTYMNNGILVSILVLLLFFFQKILKRHLSNICLYLCCMVLLLAYLIPFRPFAENSLFIITTPRVNKELTESVNSFTLQKSNSRTACLPENPYSSEITNNESLTFIPVINKVIQNPVIALCQKFSNFSSYLGNLLYQNLALLNVIWILGTFITFSYHVMKYYCFSKTMKRFTKPLIDSTILQQLHKNKQHLKIHHFVSCGICSDLGTPITIGLLHPIIILPSCTYTVEELNHILRHELVHIKRKDILFQWFLLICLSLHWYNPVIYLFGRLWKDICESSCDSIVLNNATQTERLQYSKTLLKTVTDQNQQLLFMNFNGGKKRMKSRLQSILDTKKKKTSILTIMAITLILCTTSIFSFAKENTDNTVNPYDTKSEEYINTTTDISTNSTKPDESMVTNTTSFSLEDFITEVKTYEVSPYTWGGNSPETGFDTSGFTQYIYSLYGYTLPRTSKEQCESLPTIAVEDIQPGDLVFYTNSNEEINHVAIYLGDNQIIHASNPKEGVKISSIDYRPIGSIGRVLQ